MEKLGDEAGTLLRRLDSPDKRTLLTEFRTAIQPYATTLEVNDFDAKFGDLLCPTSA